MGKVFVGTLSALLVFFVLLPVGCALLVTDAAKTSGKIVAEDFKEGSKQRNNELATKPSSKIVAEEFQEGLKPSNQDMAVGKVEVATNPSTPALYKITAEKYARIHTGMTYAQTVKIIGVDGVEMSSSELGGYRTVAVSWQNFDGSNAMLMFQNGKLITKAQFGLN